MNTTANPTFLELLLKLYNQSVQYYYYFPDVIICGHQRLEKEQFELLLAEGYLISYHTDSFGKLYYLSKKADKLLRENVRRRKHGIQKTFRNAQSSLPFEIF